MAISIIGGSGSAAQQDALTQFYVAGALNANTTNATEANVEIPIRDAGVFSHLHVNVSANDIVSATSVVYTFRVSRASPASGPSVSYTSAQTGIKEDTTHTATVVATDEVDLQGVTTSVSGVHTATLATWMVTFTPTNTANTVSKPVAVAQQAVTYTTDSATRYLNWQNFTNFSATASSETEPAPAGTARDLYVFVSANARTSDTTIGIAVRNATGSSSVTYTAAQTGAKEDSTHSDTLADDDNLGYYVTTGAGAAEAMTVTFCSMSYVTTTTYFAFNSQMAVQANVGAGVTNYGTINGATAGTVTTEALQQVRPLESFTIGRSTAHATQNGAATSGTFTATLNNGGVGTAVAHSWNFNADAIDSLKGLSVAITGESALLDWAIVNGTDNNIKIKTGSLWVYTSVPDTTQDWLGSIPTRTLIGHPNVGY